MESQVLGGERVMDVEVVPIWYVFNQSDMCSPEQPERVLIKTVDMRHSIAYLPATTATRRIRSHHGIGRCTCSECGGSVGTCDRYCRHCRAEFVGDEYEGEQS